MDAREPSDDAALELNFQDYHAPLPSVRPRKIHVYDGHGGLLVDVSLPEIRIYDGHGHQLAHVTIPASVKGIAL